MKSNNPIFANAEGFNGRNAQGNVMTQGGQPYAGYGAPSTWQTGQAGGPGYGAPVEPTYGPTTSGTPMTVDSVVQKTGASLLVLVIAAAAAWVLTPTLTSQGASTAYAVILGSGLIAFVLSIVNSRARVINPALVLAFAAFEGVMVGSISKFYQEAFGQGVVSGAVIGTVAAFAGTLAAYKFFHIKVGDKFRRVIISAMFGIVALSLLDLVLSAFGSSFGFNGFGTLGLIVSVVSLAVAIGMLILDFDFVERGVAAALPERESWRAAFALTVTLVWIYVNLLRILAIFTRR